MTALVTRPAFEPLLRFEGLCCSLGVGAGGGEGKNVIRTAAMPKSQAFTAFRLFAQHAAQGCGASMPWATMPNALVFTAFLPLCTTYCASMWSKTRCHKHPCLGATMPQALIFTAFCPFVQYTVQGWATRRFVTSVQSLGRPLQEV